MARMSDNFWCESLENKDVFVRIRLLSRHGTKGNSQERFVKVEATPYRSNSLLYTLVLCFLCCSRNGIAASEFKYSDFSQTLGLVFNGDASVATVCISTDESDSAPLHYQEKVGDYNTSTIVQTVPVHNLENGTMLEKTIAKFGHCYDVNTTLGTSDSTSDHCPSKLRLTPSHPSKAGSVWYQTLLPVVKGFETTFTFQISDHSQTCTYNVDPSYGLSHYKSCATHGGDGFAFVIHLDPRLDTEAIGANGEQLGYGGISNSLAIEFDTWTNAFGPEEDRDDVFHDHISIHSAGRNPNKASKSTSLGYWRTFGLADGEIHVVRIRYVPNRVERRYLESMTANEQLIPYLKDNGEGRRIGTLAVFIDEGVDTDIPILAIPLNLSVLLNLPKDVAYAGFTASTGLKWQKHDILNWRWCSKEQCEE